MISLQNIPALHSRYKPLYLCNAMPKSKPLSRSLFSVVRVGRYLSVCRALQCRLRYLPTYLSTETRSDEKSVLMDSLKCRFIGKAGFSDKLIWRSMKGRPPCKVDEFNSFAVQR